MPALDAYHLRGLNCGRAPFQSLTALERGFGINFLHGGVGAIQRHIDSGYDIACLHPECQLCGLHPDTVFGRLFRCSTTASIRQSILSAAELATLTDPAFALEAAGWVQRPPPLPTTPPLNSVIALDDDLDSLDDLLALP